MAFTVNDLRDLTRLLLDRPEWLSEVRRIVLTDELLSLPEIVRGLAEAQRRTEERLDQLAVRVDQLAEAQRRTEERLDQLAVRVDQLAEAQRRTEERLDQLAVRVDQLAEAQRRTEQTLALLTQTVQGLTNEMAEARGILLEMKYRNKATSYFGGWMRRPRLVDISDIWDELEGKLSINEMRYLAAADLLARGQLHPQNGGGDVWVAVEVSNVIDARDVERAIERAALLRKAGLRAVPVVAGHAPLSAEIGEMIADKGLALLINGSSAGWDDALKRALADERP